MTWHEFVNSNYNKTLNNERILVEKDCFYYADASLLKKEFVGIGPR